jgi:AcrR family transcriptional regulator
MEDGAMDGGDVSSTEPSRADLRRAQVLEAAATCFNKQGFHGASMASIAAEAGQSVGQIYRSFDSKEAVIAALVALKTEDWARQISELEACSSDLVEQLVVVARIHADMLGEPERAALSLEFLAEAARNPSISNIVREFDLAIHARLKEMFLRAGVADDTQLEARLTVVAMLLDGWAGRIVKNPQVNREEYFAILRSVFTNLLTCCK